ncbi:MAG: zinc-ribbon domain-containing protein [Acidobacteriota bacterium]|nr:zinc-ribbon domain-containing protein [Acidobacteriota bacterium]
MKITCTSCQKPLTLDETRLPMKPVLVPCPVCQTKLTVDRRNLEMAGAATAAQGTAASQPAEAPAQHHEEDDGFGARALIVGDDRPDLRQAAKMIGFMPVFIASPQQARDYFMQEYPPIVMLNPAQVTPPPLADFAPIIALTPGDRRKAFFILFSDNLRTLDGNAAFLYDVNLVVAHKDLGAFQQIYREAHGYHERLYAPMAAVLKAMVS